MAERNAFQECCWVQRVFHHDDDCFSGFSWWANNKIET